MSEKINTFDKNNVERIYNLLVLKGEALQKGHFLEWRKSRSAGCHYSNFFTAMSDQIDSLLIYFINDEISASLEDRGPLVDIIIEAKRKHFISEHFKRLEYAEDDLKKLFSERTDFMISSSIFDFKINTFSVFEKYVCDLYERLMCESKRSDKKEQRLVDLIGKYSESASEELKRSVLEDIKKISFYVSSAEKINYVLSKSKFSKEDVKKFRIFIDFYRNHRNTIHNLGINKGVRQSIEVEDIEIQLNENSPAYTANHNSAFFACRELMVIYEKMHGSVTGEFVF